MKSLIHGFLALTALAIVETSASAQIFFDNGAPNDGAGYFYADGSNSGGITAAGNVFTNSTADTALSIYFAGNYVNSVPSSDSFTIELYDVDTSDVPISTSAISSTLTDVTRTPILAGGNPTYEFSGNLSKPFALAANTTYFLDISDATDPGSSTPVYDFGVNTSADASEPLYQDESGSLTDVVDQDLSFALSDEAVPEPSAAGMLAAGFGLTALALRRKLSGA